MSEISLNEPVIIKGYCGYIVEYSARHFSLGSNTFDITLRDRNDPRITIVMEDIHANEIFKNTCS